MFRTFDLSSKALALIALAIWGTSLPLTGIVLYAKQQHLSGLEILMTGWLSPIVLNFAWFANVSFTYAVLKLLRGSAALKASLVTVILSLDAFRFDMYLMNEGGSTTPVYGYGWGAVLWFLSISLLLSAAATREREKEDSFLGANVHVWLRPLSFALAILIVGSASVFAWRDRFANSTEALRLTGLAFKRGEVCTRPEPAVVEPIRDISGPLELVLEKNLARAKYPLGDMKNLLDWGIPIIRIGLVDYSLLSTPKGNAVTSRAAIGPPSAVLTVAEGRTRDGYSYSISAQLVESTTGRIVFDQTWHREHLPVNHDHYCPDYKSFPNENEQPRRLLIEALKLPKLPTKRSSPN